MYTVGLGVDKDYKQAKNWYEKAALQQDAYAQFVLGYLYQNGFGVSQDYKKAREWYEKSANLGDLGALNNLAQIYEKGYGVKKILLMLLNCIGAQHIAVMLLLNIIWDLFMMMESI